MLQVFFVFSWPYPASIDLSLTIVHVARFRAFDSAETTSDNTTANIFFLLVQIWQCTLFYEQ